MSTVPDHAVPTEPGRGLATALATVLDWPVPSVAAAVVGPGGTVASVGDTRRQFPLASVTKLLTALACLVAVEEGTLDLDEPAGPHGPTGVTVRHLLCHAGGYGFDTDVVQPPRRTRIYSNTGFEALGTHLAERSAMTAASYIAESVLQPLAMDHTDLRDGSPAHGAWSTVADLAAFALELLRPRLVHPDTLAGATRSQFPELAGVLPGFGRHTPNDWGLGFEVSGHKRPHWTGSSNHPRTFGHFGGAGTLLWVDPVLDHALVVLTDRPFGPWATECWPVLGDAVVLALAGPD